MEGELRVDESPVGPVVRPPDPGETVVLYLGDGMGAVATGAVGAGLADVAGAQVPVTAARLALASESTVVVCRYRSAFPAALAQDVRLGFRYCQALGPVTVVGERLGATLAAALLVDLRDRGVTLPCGAVLVSPLLDLTLGANSVSLNVRADPTLDADELHRRVAEYAGDRRRSDPLLSPLYANLHGLAPVQVLAAGTDLLLDDALAFAARAARSGVAVDLRVWPEAADLRAEAVDVAADFVRRSQPVKVGQQ